MLAKYICLIFGVQVLMSVLPKDSVVTDFIQPTKVSVWQLVVIFNAILSWVIFDYCDKELLRRQAGTGHSDRRVSSVVGVLTFIRSIGATYTIACFIWILIRIALQLKPFPIEWLFIP